MKTGIIVVGSLNMDLVVSTPRHPKIGETILGSGFHTFPGGKGANQAVAAARLSGRVCMIGRVGKDDFGQSLLTNARSDGIDTTFIREDNESPTGVALITVDQAGQNTIVVIPGANGKVNPQDITAAENAFQDAGFLLAQLECPLPAVTRAVAAAKDHSLQVVLNPAPAQPLDPVLLSQVDYLLPNQTELALLTGTEDIQEALKKLHSLGTRNVIVTLGEQGVLISANGEQTHLPAHTVRVVDTVAAGDAFVGAFAVALTEGKSLMEAAAWGNAAGALSVTRPGAQPSLPKRDEFDQFLARIA